MTLIGAKPAAWGVNMGYSFETGGHASRFAVGYQGSKQAAAIGQALGSVCGPLSGVYGTCYAIGMPKARFYTNYNFNIMKSITLNFELARDSGYNATNGGTGKSAVTGVGQISALFG